MTAQYDPTHLLWRHDTHSRRRHTTHIKTTIDTGGGTLVADAQTLRADAASLVGAIEALGAARAAAREGHAALGGALDALRTERDAASPEATRKALAEVSEGGGDMDGRSKRSPSLMRGWLM